VPRGKAIEKNMVPPPTRYCLRCKHETLGWCKMKENWVILERPINCTYHRPKE